MSVTPERFDREIRRVLDDHEVAPPASDWVAISAQLTADAVPPERVLRGPWARWLRGGALLLALCLLGGLYFGAQSESAASSTHDGPAAGIELPADAPAHRAAGSAPSERPGVVAATLAPSTTTIASAPDYSELPPQPHAVAGERQVATAGPAPQPTARDSRPARARSASPAGDFPPAEREIARTSATQPATGDALFAERRAASDGGAGAPGTPGADEPAAAKRAESRPAAPSPGDLPAGIAPGEAIDLPGGLRADTAVLRSPYPLASDLSPGMDLVGRADPISADARLVGEAAGRGLEPIAARPLESLPVADDLPDAALVDDEAAASGLTKVAPGPWTLGLRLRQSIGRTQRRYASSEAQFTTSGAGSYRAVRDSTEVAQASLLSGVLLEAQHRAGWYGRLGIDYGLTRSRSRLRAGLDTVTTTLDGGVEQLRLVETVRTRQHRTHTAAVMAGGGYRRTLGPVAAYVFAEAGYELVFQARGQFLAPGAADPRAAPAPGGSITTVDDLGDGRWFRRGLGLQYGLGLGIDLSLTPRWDVGFGATYRHPGRRSGPDDPLDSTEQTTYGSLSARYRLR